MANINRDDLNREDLDPDRNPDAITGAPGSHPIGTGIGAAGAGAAANLPADLKAVFVDAPGATSYPIAGFSWIVAFRNQKNMMKGKELVQLLNYIVNDGQQFAEQLYYAPLPKAVRDRSAAAIKTIVVPGQSTR